MLVAKGIRNQGWILRVYSISNIQAAPSFSKRDAHSPKALRTKSLQPPNARKMWEVKIGDFGISRQTLSSEDASCELVGCWWPRGRFFSVLGLLLLVSAQSHWCVCVCVSVCVCVFSCRLHCVVYPTQGSWQEEMLNALGHPVAFGASKTFESCKSHHSKAPASEASKTSRVPQLRMSN